MTSQPEHPRCSLALHKKVLQQSKVYRARSFTDPPEINIRTPCFNSYPVSTVLFVPRTLRTLYSENQLYPVLKSVLHQHGTLRTPYSPYPVLAKVTVPRTSIRASRVRSYSYPVLLVLRTRSTRVRCQNKRSRMSIPAGDIIRYLQSLQNQYYQRCQAG